MKKTLKRTLSVILCLVMLLTTSCMTEIIAVIASAAITVYTNDKMTGEVLPQSVTAPETIYLAPGSSAFKYYTTFTSETGVADAGYSTSAPIKYSYSTATSVTLYVNDCYYYNGSTKTSVSAGNLKINGTTISAYANAGATATSVSGSPTTVASGTTSINLNITSGSLSGYATGTTYYIQWVFDVVASGSHHLVYAYTGIYAPLLEQAGAAVSACYIVSGTNPTEHDAYVFITGALRYAGGNRRSMFMGTTTTGAANRAAPLISFVGAEDNSTNYSIPGGDYQTQTLNESNFSSTETPTNVLCWQKSGRGDNDIRVWSKYTNTVSSYATNPEGSAYYDGEEAVAGSTVGMAYTIADTSRVSNYNQIPYLSAGYAQFHHQMDGTGNCLNHIYNVTVSDSDGDPTAVNTISCNVDTSDMEDGDNTSRAKGLYAFNGPITAGLQQFEFDYFNGYENWFWTENIGFHVMVGLYTETVNKDSLRKDYSKYLNSHIDASSYSSGYSSFYSTLKTEAEFVCNPQAYGTLPSTANSTSVEDTVLSSISTPTYGVYFYVPEVIYLWGNSTSFRWYADMSSVSVNSSTGVATPTLSTSQTDTTGNIYFYYKNAEKVKVTWSGASAVTQSGLTSWTSCSQTACSTASITGGTWTSSSTSGFITWTATYVEENVEKTVTAKSYVYAVNTTPISGSAAGRYSSSNSSRECYGAITLWLSGAHANTGNGKTSDGSGVYKYKYLVSGSSIPTASDKNWANVFDSNGSGTGGGAYWATDDDVEENFGEGNMYVDTSRYTNYNQIPGLYIGLDNNYRYGNGTSGKYSRIGFYETNTESATSETDKRLWEADTGNSNTYPSNFATKSFNRTISTSRTSETFNIRGFSEFKGSGNGSTRSSCAHIFLTTNLINRQPLRDALAYATKYSFALQEEYFGSGNTTWNNYKSYLSTVQEALTKVNASCTPGTLTANSAGEYTGGSGAAWNLVSTVQTLLASRRNTAPRNTTDYTATQRNLGLIPQQGGTYKIVEIGEAQTDGTSTISKTYKTYDAVKFTAETYNGYTYVGYHSGTSYSINGTLSASDYTAIHTNNSSNYPARVTASSQEELNFGNAKGSLGYTFFYLLDPEVLFNNEFDFDSVTWSNGTYCTITNTDYYANSLTIKYTGSDSTQEAIISDTQSAPMSLIGGHTYRFSYDFSSSGSATPRFTILTSGSGIGYYATLTNGSTYVEAMTSGGTFKVPTDRTNLVFRLGASNATTNETFTYSNIYIEDITNTYGNVDDITAAYPQHKIVAAGSQIGDLATISRSNYQFKGWYTSKNSTTGNGEGTLVSSTSTMPAYNYKLYAQWELIPEVIFDNEIDFDSWATKSGASSRASYTSFDKAQNSLTIRNNAAGSDTYTGTYGSASYDYMELIEGHTYRFSYNVQNNSSASFNCKPFIFTYPSTSFTWEECTCWSYMESIAAGVTTDKEFTFTVPSGKPYVQFRMSLNNTTLANQEMIVSEMYLTDITAPDSNPLRTDDKTNANPEYKDKAAGETVGNLAISTRTGYALDGWYTGKDANGNGSGTKYETTTVMSATNVQLWSKWLNYDYTINYTMNNGTNDSGNPSSGEFDTIITLNKPTKADWTFEGWTLEGTNPNYSTAKWGTSSSTVTTDISSGTKFGKDNATIYVKNLTATNGGSVTLVAHWSRTISATFYYVNASTKKTVSETKDVTIYDSATTGSVTATTPSTISYDGRSFAWAGWRKDNTAGVATCTGATQTISGGEVFRAIYTGTLTLSYNANGGSGAPAAQTATQYLNSTATVNTSTFPKSSYEFTVSTTVPTRADWTFDGWATSNTATSGTYGASPKTTKYTISTNKTLYAIWNRTYTATFYYYASTSGDVGYVNVPVTIYNADTSGTVNVPAIASVTIGEHTYTGRGWALDDETADADLDITGNTATTISISSNVQYYASYSKEMTITFHYCTLSESDNSQFRGAGQASVTDTGIRYMNHLGSFSYTDVNIPSAVKNSHAGISAQTYNGLTAKTYAVADVTSDVDKYCTSTATTVQTDNTDYYAIYSESLVFYYYNGSSHTSKSVVRYMLSNGTTYNNTLSAAAPTPSTYNNATWTGKWTYDATKYDDSTYQRTPLGTGVNALYAIYSKEIKLNYNGNTATTNVPTEQSATMYYVSKSGGVNKYNYQLTVTTSYPTWSGYTFLKWNTKADGSGTDYSANGTVSFDNTNTTVTLYAQWKQYVFHVYAKSNTATDATTTTDYTISSAGGSVSIGTGTGIGTISGSADHRQAPVTVGTKVSITAAPVDGYDFVGWYTDADFTTQAVPTGTGETYTSRTIHTSAMVSTGLTYYAKFSVHAYTITTTAQYKTATNSNTLPTTWTTGTTGGTIKLDGTAITSTTCYHGQSVTLTAAPNTGYVFDSWVNATSGAVSNVTADVIVNARFVSSQVTLTANAMVNSLTSATFTNVATGGKVSVSGIIGTATGNNSAIASGNVYYNKSGGNVIAGTPVSGYKFVGWQTATPSTTNTTLAKETATYSVGAITSNKTYYARFEICNYTITFDLNKGTGTSTASGGSVTGYYSVAGTRVTAATALSSPVSMVYTSTATITAPTREGYTFTGWQLKSGSVGTLTNAAAPATGTATFNVGAGNATLVAQWSKNTFKLSYNANGVTVTSGTLPGDTTLTYDTDTASASPSAISATIPTSSDGKKVFVGWYEDTGATGTAILPGDNKAIADVNSWYNAVGAGKTKTLYAKWLDVSTAQSVKDAKDTTYQNLTEDVVTGVEINADGTYKSTMTTGTQITKYTTEAYKQFTDAISAFDTAYTNVRKEVTATTVTAITNANSTLANAPTNILDANKASVNADYNNNFYIKDSAGNTTRYSLADMNLNHYTTTTLNDAMDAKDHANDYAYSSGTTLRKVFDTVSGGAAQTKLNAAVEQMAKDFVNKTKLDVEPTYKVAETPAAVATALGNNDDVNGVSYVFSSYCGYTYYCYTNKTNPKIVINVDEIADTNGRVCYPTSATKLSGGTATINKVTVANTSYDTLTTAGLGTTLTSSNANYYKQKTQIVMQPSFSTDKQEISYTFKAQDDAYAGVNGTNINYATTTALTSGLSGQNEPGSIESISTARTTSSQSPANGISIVICYKGTGLSVYSDENCQWGNHDLYLNKVHLYRSSGGASNSQMVDRIGGTKSHTEYYTVVDPVYGQSNYGSFLYVFTNGTNSVANNSINLGGCTSEAQRIAKVQSFFKTTSNFNTAVTNGFKQRNQTYSGTKGSGLGYLPWLGSGWSIGFYPLSNAYCYVHLVDRWGNSVDRVFQFPSLDYDATKLNSSSAGSCTITESGGSGIDTLSLNSSTLELIADENSVLVGDTFMTTGNTLKLYTGEANKTYTLTMNDNATNASTASVKTDADGYIVMEIDDTEYTDGVYSFELNGYSVSLYSNLGKVIDVDYEKTVGTVNTYDVKVLGRANMLQFIELDKGNGTGTRSFDRYHKDVTITSYNESGEQVTSTARDIAYEIWTVKTNLANETIGARVKEAGSYVWESMEYVYEFENEYADVASDVISAKLASESGKAGPVSYTITTGKDATGVQLVNEEGETFTLGLDKTTVNEDETLTFKGTVWFHGTGTRTATVKVRDIYGWEEATTLEYEINQ